MGKKEQARSYLAQGVVESLLNDNNVQNTTLFYKNPITKRKELNEKILDLFLRIHSQHQKNEKLLVLLRELNNQGYQLPDLLCLNPETAEPFFHEVKTHNRKLKLSDLNKKQKEAIEILGKNGYVVHITNVRFEIELNENKEVLDYSNKEEGRALSEEVPKNHKVKVKIKENSIKETHFPNVFIEEIEVY